MLYSEINIKFYAKYTSIKKIKNVALFNEPLALKMMLSIPSACPEHWGHAHTKSLTM